MKCSRFNCLRDSVHFHIGAIESNATLCDPCFREWKELNEKVRLLFVRHLTEIQTAFIDKPVQKVLAEESVDAEMISLMVSAPITVESDPVINISENDSDYDDIVFSD